MTAGDPLVARATTVIDAPREEIWNTLVATNVFERLMPATESVADWRPGGLLRWRATLERRSYDVQGRVLRVEPREVLALEYDDPLMRATHRVTIELRDEGAATRVRSRRTGTARPPTWLTARAAGVSRSRI